VKVVKQTDRYTIFGETVYTRGKAMQDDVSFWR
jgi:hypothetical protein